MSYGCYYRDERTLEQKLESAEDKLRLKRELYRRCIIDPEYKKSWEHYKNEDHCVSMEIREVNSLKQDIIYRDLPDIDRKIYHAKDSIGRAKYAIKEAKNNLNKAEEKLKEEEHSLHELEKEKIIIELAGIK